MKHPAHSLRSSAAFTLIELLTVIAIIGILAAIIIPTVGKVRSNARNAQCIANLREWGRSVMLYANDNKGTYTISNFGSAGGSGPYKHYLAGGSDTQYARVRACPSSSDAVTGNSLTYTMVRPNINGSIAPASMIGRLPLSRAQNPSQFMLRSESVV
jgi:prepilin-type N-terminal cleavage/methylation domain-containing protein